MYETTEEEGFTGREFSFLGLVLRTVYAKQITERLKLGGTFKIIRESTGADLSMTSFGFDIGSNFNTGLYGMVLGMCISNLGPDARYMGTGLDLAGEDDQQKKTEHFQKSPYWQTNYKLICGMENKIPEKPMDGNFLLENVLNLNLFPYHSNESDDFPSKFTVKQLEVVLHHLALVFDLIEEKKPRYCFFNGKVWETLLIKHKLIDIKFSEPKVFKENSKGAKFSMYFGKKRKTRYVIFDKFLSRTHYYGVTDDDLNSDIPNFIKERLGS